MDYKMDAVLAAMKTILISLYISIRVLGGSGVLSMNSNILKDIFFLTNSKDMWQVKLVLGASNVA